MNKPPLVVFATCTYTGTAVHEFHEAMIETHDALKLAGIPSRGLRVGGDPYLSKARNRLATDFLMNHAAGTHLFFLDDDIGWPGRKVVEFIQRDEDVIGGIYPKKTDNPEWPLELALDDAGQPIEKAGLYQVKLAPTGFLCIKRHVLEKMAATAGQYHDSTHPTAAPFHWNIFDMGWFLPDGSRPVPAMGRMGQFWGEDYYFCRRWRDMGGAVWIDPDIEFSHTGRKSWRGSFKPALEQWIAEREKAVAKAAE